MEWVRNPTKSYIYIHWPSKSRLPLLSLAEWECNIRMKNIYPRFAPNKWTISFLWHLQRLNRAAGNPFLVLAFHFGGVLFSRISMISMKGALCCWFYLFLTCWVRCGKNGLNLENSRCDVNFHQQKTCKTSNPAAKQMVRFYVLQEILISLSSFLGSGLTSPKSVEKSHHGPQVQLPSESTKWLTNREWFIVVVCTFLNKFDHMCLKWLEYMYNVVPKP